MKKNIVTANILLLLAALLTGDLCAQPAESYLARLEAIKAKKAEIALSYQTARSQNARDSIITIAQEYLLDQISDKLFPYWYGTQWEFYGQTRTPRSGSIACGYFVTTILYDAGFAIPRVKWAQSASEYFIQRLSTDIKRFSNVPIETVEKYISDRSDGLYIVGLDCHVGFICKRGNSIKFVHSSYYKPEIGVMSENLAGWNPLNDSKYRVIGRILHKEMTRRWILDERY